MLKLRNKLTAIVLSISCLFGSNLRLPTSAFTGSSIDSVKPTKLYQEEITRLLLEYGVQSEKQFVNLLVGLALSPQYFNSTFYNLLYTLEIDLEDYNLFAGNVCFLYKTSTTEEEWEELLNIIINSLEKNENYLGFTAYPEDLKPCTECIFGCFGQERLKKEFDLLRLTTPQEELIEVY